MIAEWDTGAGKVWLSFPHIRFEVDADDQNVSVFDASGRCVAQIDVSKDSDNAQRLLRAVLVYLERNDLIHIHEAA